MGHYRWEGTAVATSSLMHGGEALGTITYLRREVFLSPEGHRSRIPVVSGNAVRGLLRDLAADQTWEALRRPALPLPVTHALWAGGALVKVKGEPLSGNRLATLRAAVPMVGVFGAAGGGRIISGCLSVGKLVPICTQTRHVLPVELARQPGLPDLHDLLQIEEYSRFPQRENPTASAYPPVAPLVPGEDPPSGMGDPGGLLRYGVETFVPGTRFHTWFTLTHAVAKEAGFFAEVLAAYTGDASVGGNRAKGHGRLRFDLTAAHPAAEPGVEWKPLTDQERTAATHALSWLA